MDYETNQKFFDPKRLNQFKTILFCAILLLAAAAVLIPTWGFGVILLRRLGEGCAIVGVALLFVALSRLPKEGDVTSTIEQNKQDFQTFCGDALGYPNDLATESMLFVGAVPTDKLPEGAFPAKKLKSGSFLTQEVQLSFLYICKAKVQVFTRTFSLVEEKNAEQTFELTYDQFDSAAILPASDKQKGYSLNLTKEGKTVFETPLFANDYEQDDFVASLLHALEQANGRKK